MPLALCAGSFEPEHAYKCMLESGEGERIMDLMESTGVNCAMITV